MDEVKAIRIQALLDVMEGNFLYQYRRICRWYSSTFHTPLTDVEELPIEHVLLHFFENQFEQTSKSRRLKIATELTETAKDVRKRKKKEKAMSDEAFLKRVAEQARQERLAKEAKEQNVKKEVEQAAQKDMLNIPAADLPEFSMNFAEDGNLSVKEGAP